MVEMNSVQKVSRNGNTLVINIPKKIVDIMDLNVDDYIQVSFIEIVGKKKFRKKENGELPKL